jgi:2-polyprenyl-3-methyl-5-hydroxy-6-metoxy-1,4-benzoquinol methylase
MNKQQNFSVGQVRQVVTAYKGAITLATATKFDIFTLLSKESRLTAHDIASRLNLNGDALELLCNALVLLGFLEKQGNAFSNAPIAEEFLVKGKPRYQGGYIAYAFDIIRDWLELEDRLKTGHAAEPVYKSIVGMDPEKTRHFLAAMHTNAMPNAQFIAKKIDFSGVASVLDVGGGTGAYSIVLAQKYRNLRADVVDLEPVVEIAKEYIASAGVQDRVRAIPGSYYERESYGNGYDSILMFAVIHQEQPNTVLEMLKYAHDALNDTGFVILSTFFLDENRVAPPFSVMFALEMLVITPHGRAYTKSEVEDLINRAGFSHAEFIPGETGPKGLGFFVAYK